MYVLDAKETNVSGILRPERVHKPSLFPVFMGGVGLDRQGNIVIDDYD